MGLDYMIDHSCRVKETLPPDSLLSLIKQRNRCMTIIDLLKKEGRTDEQILSERFRMEVYTPSGSRVKEQSIAELLETTHPLEELQNECITCSANCGRVFGCFGSIGYPISRKAEEWLAGAARKAGEGNGPGLLPLRFIIEHNVDGGIISCMRNDPGGMYFELKKPLEIPVTEMNGIIGKKTVNSDQLLNMFVRSGHMNCGLMRALLFMTGSIQVQQDEPAAGTVPFALQLKEADGRVVWYVFNLFPGISDDDSIRMLKDFLRSMYVAYCIDREMQISP